VNPLPVIGIGVALLTWLLVKRGRRYLCTDSSCGTPIPADATVCPGCGGRIGGRIRVKEEIFANEE
jgi:hypothetical protein